jgi:HEAT repeat protein
MRPKAKFTWGKESAVKLRHLLQGLGAAHITLALGPDGWLYIAASAGDHHAEGSDGSRATVLRSGAVFRCRPDGSRLHVFATGLHDPGMPVFDLAGNLFLIDAGIPHGGDYASGRLLHVLDGGDYGFRLAPAEALSIPDARRSAWHGDRPGTLGPIYRTGKGPPSPLAIYNDCRLPEAYRGLVLHPDPVGHRLRAYRLDSKGVTFAVAEEFDLLSSKDDAFRPIQAAAGPDGALYVFDNGGGGRLIRLTWAGTTDEEALKPHALDNWAKVAKLEAADLVKALANEDASVREVARRELVRRGDKNRAAVLKLFTHEDTPLAAQAAALGVLQAMPDAAVLKAIGSAAENGDPELRAMAASVIAQSAKEGDKDAQAALLQALGDSEPAVKRAVAMAMARLKGPGAADNIASALSFDRGKDGLLTLGLVAALDNLGEAGISAFITLADSGAQKDIDKVADLYSCLRSKAAFAALPGLLRNPHMVAAQRAALAKAGGQFLLDPPQSLDTAARVVIDAKKEVDSVKAALLEALSVPGVKGGKEVVEWAVERLEDENEAVRLAAAAAVGNFRPEKGEQALIALLEKNKDAAVARALGAYRGGLAGERAEIALTKLLDADGEVGRAALLALSAEKAAERARKLLASEDEDDQKAAAASLARTASGAKELAKQLAARKLPEAVRPEILVGLRRHAPRDAEAMKLLLRLSK